jgi:hypothetical protein
LIELLVFHVRRTTPSTLSSAATELPFAEGETRRAALPDLVLMRLAAHLDHAGKIPLTDFCNRHPLRAPDDRSTLEPAAFAAKTASTQNIRGV